MRVVSVLPSATEIVCALGARAELVGRSAECDYPADVTELPVVMHPKALDGERPSGEIDRRVREARGRGESLYTLDVPQLRSLRPDLILTQDLCGVCSVTEEEVASACARAGIVPRVVALTPRTLEEVGTTFETVGSALGRGEQGRRLRESLRETGAAEGRPGPRVAVVEWLDPPILAGLWTPDIVRRAGGAAVGPVSGEVGQRTTWEAIRALEPELMVLSPCSFSVGRTRRELEDRSLAEAIDQVGPALGTFIADEAFFSRPGPRLAEGVRLLRTLLDGERRALSLSYAPWPGDRGVASA